MLDMGQTVEWVLYSVGLVAVLEMVVADHKTDFEVAVVGMDVRIAAAVMRVGRNFAAVEFEVAVVVDFAFLVHRLSSWSNSMASTHWLGLVFALAARLAPVEVDMMFDVADNSPQVVTRKPNYRALEAGIGLFAIHMQFAVVQWIVVGTAGSFLEVVVVTQVGLMAFEIEEAVSQLGKGAVIAVEEEPEYIEMAWVHLVAADLDGLAVEEQKGS